MISLHNQLTILHNLYGSQGFNLRKSQQDVNELRDELQEVHAALQSKHLEIEKLKNENKQLKRQKRPPNTGPQGECLDAKIRNLERENEDLVVKLGDLQQKHESLVAGVFDRQIEELQGRNNVIEAKLRNLELERSEMHEGIRFLSDQVRAFQEPDSCQGHDSEVNWSDTTLKGERRKST